MVIGEYLVSKYQENMIQFLLLFLIIKSLKDFKYQEYVLSDIFR
jgi:uncharacterized membrane protein